MTTNQDVLNDLRQKYTPEPKTNVATVQLEQRAPKTEKPGFEYFSADTQNMAYATLSSGDKVAMFENYVPGSNNMERLAQQQSTGDKWANGVVKALSKTGNAVIGGTLGIVNGLGSAIKDGEISSIYDNNFSNWLNDLDTKLNYNLPNYYTEQENNKGVFGQLGTANFWADKFLGGLSFTAGAIISEGIWAYATGGTSLATAGARWGTKLTTLGRGVKFGLGEVKTIEGLSKYKQILKNLKSSDQALDLGGLPVQTANKFGKAGEFASAVTFMGRSAGYEASVEALQFKKEAEENFFRNFEQLNGREPNEEETVEFYKNLTSSANGVFAANMAIVGSSNLVTLGNILDIKSPINLGISKFIDKKAFGYGIAKTIDDTGKASYGAIEATGKQKIARKVFGYGIKPAVTEGLFEEGLQGVTNKTANKWLEHTYNPKYTTESFHLIDAMGDSLAEQYGTEEGWKENMLGILIGIAGGTINTTAENKQKANELEFESAVANKFQAETIQSLLLPNRIQQANRIAGFSEQAKEEAQKGNITKSALAQSSATLTYINAKQVLGESNENIVAEVGEALNKITEEQFREAGIENSQEYKKEVLQEFSELAETWKANKTYWKYMIGQKLVGEDSLEATALEDGIGSNFSKTAGVIEALAWQTTIGEKAMKMMGEAKTVIAREVGKEYADAVELSDKLKRQTSNRRGQVTKLTAQYKQLEKERKDLTDRIALLDGRPTTPDGDKAGLSPRVAMTARLQQLSTKIEEVNGQLNTIAEELSKADIYAKGIERTETEVLEQSLITGQDLLELEGKLQKFKGILETINPQRKQYLEDILSEYIDAEEVFTQAQVTQQILLRPDFKLKNIGSWLGGKLGSKVMEEDSKEWLQNALNSYAKAKVSSADAQLQQEQTAVTEEVVDNKVAKPKSEEVIDETTMSPVEKYKKRIETALKTYDLTYLGENYDGVTNNIPTKEEIEEFQTVEKGTKRYNELYSKLSNWKLLDSIVDIENNSIVEIVELIEQLEQEVQQEDTKDEVIPEDVVEIVDTVEGTNITVDYSLAQNTQGSVTVVKPNDRNVYRFSHLKIDTVINALGGEVTVNGKPYTNQRLKPNDKVVVDGMTITYLAGGVLEMNINDFLARQQALNMYVVDTGIVKWSYKDVYTVKGEDFVKMRSDFQEDIDAEAIYDLQPTDTLTLVVDDTDGFNKTAFGATQEQFKIFLQDSKGRKVSTLKALKEGSTQEDFLLLRQEAFKRWNDAGRPTSMNLGIKVGVEQIYFGTPELAMNSNNRPINIPITDKGVSQIITQGFIENGVLNLAQEVAGVNTVFAGKLSRNTPDKKIPIVVIKKGTYKMAFPISMIKTASPQTELFNSILNSDLTPQEKVRRINTEIQNQRIQTEKLTYSDLLDQEKVDRTREAFEQKQTFISATELADPKYRKERLATDASIGIDLENLDKAISDAKIRISLENIEYTTDLDLKNERLSELEDSLSDLALEVYNDFLQNADTKYINSRGEILEDVPFTDAFDNNEVVEAKNNLEKLGNIKILKQAFTVKPPKIVINALGVAKVQQIQDLIKQYDFVKSQITVAESLLEDGQKNICN